MGSDQCPLVLYGASQIQQRFDTWLLLAKGITICAAAFDVDVFPMHKTAKVMESALQILRRRIVDPELIVSEIISFDQYEKLTGYFENYQNRSGLKMVIRFD